MRMSDLLLAINTDTVHSRDPECSVVGYTEIHMQQR